MLPLPDCLGISWIWRDSVLACYRQSSLQWPPAGGGAPLLPPGYGPHLRLPRHDDLSEGRRHTTAAQEPTGQGRSPGDI